MLGLCFLIIGVQAALLIKAHKGEWVPIKYAGLQIGDPCLISDNHIKSCLVSLNQEELFEATHQEP